MNNRELIPIDLLTGKDIRIDMRAQTLYAFQNSQECHNSESNCRFACVSAHKIPIYDTKTGEMIDIGKKICEIDFRHT
jgi:hypothetical protein